MPENKSNVYDIVQGIHQAAANGYDGALDKDGERVEVGLKRDEGHPINDSRIMDGFGVKISADQLTITYQSDIKLKDVHEKGFENDVEDVIEKVASFLKKEYKRLTGNALSLSPKKKSFQAIVQYVSKVRVFVMAKKVYTIKSMKGVDGIYSNSNRELDKSFKKWLELGSTGEKPSNVMGKGGKDRNKKDKEIVKVLGGNK